MTYKLSLTGNRKRKKYDKYMTENLLFISFSSRILLKLRFCFHQQSRKKSHAWPPYGVKKYTRIHVIVELAIFKFKITKILHEKNGLWNSERHNFHTVIVMRTWKGFDFWCIAKFIIVVDVLMLRNPPARRRHGAKFHITVSRTFNAKSLYS